ncbi:MAG TPA: hypothetical protein VGS41_00225 [Chthonomonadales bacterium]|nr:hypothetical protein [Chthonomonadales bacterium]
MEPLEWAIFGLVFLAGSIVGANGKEIMRTAAKGFMLVEDKTRHLSANMREDFHDAVEEARFDRTSGTPEPAATPRRRRQSNNSNTGGEAAPAKRARRPRASTAGRRSRRTADTGGEAGAAQ